MAKYTKEELQKVIEEYWQEVSNDEIGIPTKENFMLKLGISSRDTYNCWKQEGHELADTIKKAELRIADYWVQRLGTSNSTTGAIFYLKNAFKEDFKDRQEFDHTSAGSPIPLLSGQSNGNNNKSNQKTAEAEKKD